MTSIRQLLAVGALIALPSTVSAQQGRQISLGISGGLSTPTSDLGEKTESGYNVTAHLVVKPAGRQHLMYRGDISYDRWATKQASSNVVKSNASSTGMIGNVLYVVGGARATMRPYALVGAGFYQSQLTLAGATTGLRSESADIGVQAGGGVQFALAGMTTFVEAKYVNVRRAGTPWSYLPITFGIRL